MRPSEPKASLDYPALRARLIERGITLRGFALEHGYKIPTVYNAARKQRRGVKSVMILRQLEALAHG
jgi:hypothetical protein